MQKRDSQKGVILIMAIVFLGILVTLSGAIVGYTTLQIRAQRESIDAGSALALAEAGIDKAISQMNLNPSYAGETATDLGNGQFSVEVSSIDTNTKQITSTGYVPSAADPKETRIVKARMSLNTNLVAFNFGVQVGQGGIQMNNNSVINGNLYSNGNVTGNGTVTGDVIVAGGSSSVADQSWATENADADLGSIASRSDMAQSFVPTTSGNLTKVSLYLKKVGSPANIVVRLVSDNAGSPSKTVLTSGTISAANVTGSYGWIDASFSTTPSVTAGTTYWILLDASVNSSNYFKWGMDTNNGYVNGIGKYSSNWNATTPVWNSLAGDLNFKVFLGDTNTSIQGITINGNAKANTLSSCTILKDAYYSSQNTCSVGGNQYSNQTDPPIQAMPISDAQIEDWKQIALSGGTVNGSYTVNGSVTVGPKKFNGDLTVNGTLTLSGPVWVAGNIIFNNNAVLKVASTLGNAGTVIFADNPADLVNSSKIILSNNVIFEGSGNPSSYPLVLATSTANDAINLNNNVSGAIFYASAGTISVSNNATATQLTGYSISLSNNVTINYSMGLANANFSDGPGGSWQFVSGSYYIMK